MKNVSIPALSITEPDCHGFLWKQGDSHKSWKKRYCVLKYGCVFYYEDMSNEVAIGVFKLHNYTISQSKHVKYGFEAEPPVRKMRTYHFYADSEIDFKRYLCCVIFCLLYIFCCCRRRHIVASRCRRRHTVASRCRRRHSYCYLLLFCCSFRRCSSHHQCRCFPCFITVRPTDRSFVRLVSYLLWLIFFVSF